MTSHADSWKARVFKELEFFRNIENDFPPFKNWQWDLSPDTRSEQLLKTGLLMLYAGNPENLFAKFLNWVIERIDRAMAEKKFDHPRAAFPQNRAYGLRSRGHATFLRDGEIAVDDLRQAVDDFEKYNEDIPKHQWDAMSEADVLAPVRLALIAGDFSRVDELLPFRWPIKWHKEEAQILLEINKRLLKGEPVTQQLADQFVAYFERVRDPKYKPDIHTETAILRFELGLLFCQYIDPTETPSPERVIEVISR